MKHLMKICIVLTAIAFIASPAFAEVQNVKVSGDILTRGAYRESYTLQDDAQQTVDGALSDEHDNLIATAVRLRVDADLTDNVSTVVRLLSEYQWDTEANQSVGADGGADANDIVMDLANVTLKEVFYQPLTVTVGRQDIRLGNGLVVGDPDTNALSGDANMGFGDLSLRKSFDAVTAVLDYDPLTVDLIYAKINETGTDKDDEDLYGINAGYKFDQYDAEAEVYWILSKNEDETAPVVTNANDGHEIHTIGTRGSIAVTEDLNLMGEFAWQRGDYDQITIGATRDVSASAFQIGADYSGLNLAWDPIIKAGITHYSGEEVGNTGDMSAWLPLYEDQSHGVVANFVLSGMNGGQNSNADIYTIGASATPMEDLSISADIFWFYLDKKLVLTDNALANTGTALDWANQGTRENDMNLKADDELGYEVDLALNYDYTEDVKMGLCAGWFVPGEALDGVSGTDEKCDQTALQVMATLGVNF
ncbi:alginate export family protein [Candidatus Omnitrophota bacterium]